MGSNRKDMKGGSSTLLRGAARLALSLLLLLANEVALAGELCHALVAGGTNQVQATIQAAAPVGCDAAPCDVSAVRPAGCVSAFIVAASALDSGLVKHAGGSTPVACARPTVAIAGGSIRTADPVPATAAHPAVPAYLLYHRFLS